jgi:dihydropteroate synthase
MGIVNATPDSFSGDGMLEQGADAAIARGMAKVKAGADIIDVGGESTRPGQAPVPAGEELGRVLPVVSGLARAVVTASVLRGVDVVRVHDVPEMVAVAEVASALRG